MTYDAFKYIDREGQIRYDIPQELMTKLCITEHKIYSAKYLMYREPINAACIEKHMERWTIERAAAVLNFFAIECDTEYDELKRIIKTKPYFDMRKDIASYPG